MNRQELQKIYQDFIGKGKVQSISLIQAGENLWEWKYREGTKIATITDANRSFLEKMHIEFGGKNPETCRASDKFLELNSWNAEDLLLVGHRITKIRVKGYRETRKKRLEYNLPEGTGSNQPIKSKRQIENDTITLFLKDSEQAELTRAFSNPEEFDQFKRFIITHESLKDLTWYIQLLGTESKATTDQCVWKRQSVGDGTRRMALELLALNGKHYTECKRDDLIAAADDMFDSPCKRISVKKPKEFHREICFYAAEDGQVSLEGCSAATDE